MSFPITKTIGELEADGALIAIQDGNHGEKHPKTSDYVEEGIPFIMANNLGGGFVDLIGCNKITQGRAEKLRIGFSKAGDVLLTHKGTVGNVAVVGNVEPYVMLTPQVTYYRVNSELLSNDFLAYAFRDPVFQREIKSLAEQSTRPYIGVTAQRRLKVNWQPIERQKLVVERIKPYDDLIENNRRRIALLEQAARLLYREWFVHFRFPGHETAKFVDGLPEGWDAATLGDHVELRKEAVKPDNFRSDDIHIGLEHIPRRSFTLSEWEGVEKLASHKFRFEAGDIIFGKIRPYFHKVGFALRGGVASSDAFVWRVKDQRLWPLVMAATSSDFFVAVASKTVREGSKMPRADWKVLIDFSIPIPPSDLLSNFNAQISKNAELCKSLALQNLQLTRARDLLLPRLMDGRIPV